MLALKVVDAQTGAITAHRVSDTFMTPVRVSLPAGWHNADGSSMLAYAGSARAKAAVATVEAIKTIHGLTASKLAALLGVSTRSIENWCQRVSVPTAIGQSLIFRIAGELFPAERSEKTY